jgi:predicted FMN-binding regulatory protein PaiB
LTRQQSTKDKHQPKISREKTNFANKLDRQKISQKTKISQGQKSAKRQKSAKNLKKENKLANKLDKQTWKQT